jgi:hypothetical protein
MFAVLPGLAGIIYLWIIPASRLVAIHTPQLIPLLDDSPRQRKRDTIREVFQDIQQLLSIWSVYRIFRQQPVCQVLQAVREATVGWHVIPCVGDR